MSTPIDVKPVPNNGSTILDAEEVSRLLMIVMCRTQTTRDHMGIDLSTSTSLSTPMSPYIPIDLRVSAKKTPTERLEENITSIVFLFLVIFRGNMVGDKSNTTDGKKGSCAEKIWQ